MKILVLIQKQSWNFEEEQNSIAQDILYWSDIYHSKQSSLGSAVRSFRIMNQLAADMMRQSELFVIP